MALPKHRLRGMGAGKTHGVVTEAKRILRDKRESTERVIWAKRALYRHKVIGWDALTDVERVDLPRWDV